MKLQPLRSRRGSRRGREPTSLCHSCRSRSQRNETLIENDGEEEVVEVNPSSSMLHKFPSLRLLTITTHLLQDSPRDLRLPVKLLRLQLLTIVPFPRHCLPKRRHSFPPPTSNILIGEEREGVVRLVVVPMHSMPATNTLTWKPSIGGLLLPVTAYVLSAPTASVTAGGSALSNILNAFGASLQTIILPCMWIKTLHRNRSWTLVLSGAPS